MNNQTRFFNAIPRVVWGNTAGWRVRTDRGSGRSRPVTETGQLPDVDISDIQTVSSLPRIVSTTFGASVKSVFTAQLEGGVGDVLALENENAQLDHIKEINEELLAEVMDETSKACNPINDKRGTIEYRRQVAGVLAKRVILLAEKRALDKKENK